LQQAADAYDSLVTQSGLARGAGRSPAVEDYLETIYELDESGIPPMRARLVERLGVSAPTVSETVARLDREGYVTLDDQRVLRLTSKGLMAATAVMRRHRLAERLLVDILKVPWHQVHEEAHRLEHAISETLEPYLVSVLGDPGTCPHGNPIPGSANHVTNAGQVPLTELAPGAPATVRRIDEEIEARPEAMRDLEQLLLMPGHPVRLDAVEAGRVRVTTDAGTTSLDVDVATKVYASA
jgi:DtxR family transcriptional regulator, Mn-dependent transcriptional regulator